MEHTNHNSKTEGQFLFNITADSMFLSDRLRLTSYIEGTVHDVLK